jgi:integrase
MLLPILPQLAELLPPRDNVVGLDGKAKPFLLTKTGKPFTPNYFTAWFHDACKEAGLPHLSTHGTRKLSAKMLRKNGCPLSVLMGWTGHKSEDQLRVYLEDVEHEEMAGEAAKFMPAMSW